MPRVEWSCPGCGTRFAVPTTEGLTLCPSCSTESGASVPLPRLKVQERVKPILLTVTISAPSRRVVIGVMLGVSPGISGMLSRCIQICRIPGIRQRPVSREDLDKTLVRTWMNENLKLTKWAEEKWWPAVELKGYQCLNTMNILADAEEVKRTSTMSPSDVIDDFRETLNEFQKRPVRRICGMQYRAVDRQVIDCRHLTNIRDCRWSCQRTDPWGHSV